MQFSSMIFSNDGELANRESDTSIRIQEALSSIAFQRICICLTYQFFVYALLNDVAIRSGYQAKQHRIMR